MSEVRELHLPRSLLEALIAHAREVYPEEACGLILGRGSRGTRILRGRNIASDPRHTFLLDPDTLIAQLEWEEKGEHLLAIYHSHPQGPPYPSPVDARWAAYPDVPHLICSLRDPEHPEFAVWLLLPEEEGEEPPPPSARPVARHADFWALHESLETGERYRLWWREGATWRYRSVRVQEVGGVTIDD